MKLRTIIFSTIALFMLTGCEDKEAKAKEKKSDPTFMFWCFRQENVSADYHVPEMKTPAAASYLLNKMRSVPGYVSSDYDLSSQILTVEYQSSAIRAMNFEEAIALAGFKANNRPANPKANIPAGVK